MKASAIQPILEILAMIVNAISVDMYSDHLSGLGHEDWKKCMNSIRKMQGLEPL